MFSFLRTARQQKTGMLIALLLPSMVYAAEKTAPLTLEQAITLVEQQNPALHAQRQHALALATRPEQVGSLPEPTLSVSALNLPTDTFSRTQEGMSQLQFAISQKLPFPGTLALKSEAAALLAQAASHGSQELLLQLIRHVKNSWWNLVYLDQALSTVTRNQVLLRQFIRISETKYKVGKGLQQDVLLAQLELSKLLDVAIGLKSSRIKVQARFNALLNRPAYLKIILPQNMNKYLPELAAEQVLIQQALASRPILAKQRKHIQAAQSRIGLAKKGYYPDFTLGAKYGTRADTPNGITRSDLSSVSLSMSMPFFTRDKHDAQLQQRQAELIRSEFMLQDVKTHVFTEISIGLASYNQAKEQSMLYQQGIIPQAKQTVASMLAAYQVNKVDFLNLVQAQVTLYNYETQYWQVLAKAKQSLADLDAAVGETTEKHHE